MIAITWLGLALLVSPCLTVLELEPPTDQLRHELDAALETCTGSYSVTAASGTEVKVSEVKVKRDGVCRKIARGKFKKAASKARVESSMHVAEKSEDYVTNITWTYSPEGGHIPGRFIVALDFVDERTDTDLDRVCIVFKIKKPFSLKPSESLAFHLDCIPLLSTPDVLMYLQIWSISDRKFSPPCIRVRRSLPPDRASNTCGTVECSKTMAMPVSMSSHSADICSCFRERHGKPMLTWTHNKVNRTFTISFFRIPPYIENVEIDIVDSNTSKSHETLNGTDIVLGPNNLTVTSNKAYPPGNYSVVLHSACPEEKSLSHFHFCTRHEYIFTIYKDQYLIVEETKPSTQFAPAALATILGVVGVMLLIALITALVFIYHESRRKKSHRSSEITGDIELLAVPLISPNNTDSHVTGPEDQADTAETELTDHKEGKTSEWTRSQPLLEHVKNDQHDEYQDVISDKTKGDTSDKTNDEKRDKTKYVEQEQSCEYLHRLARFSESDELLTRHISIPPEPRNMAYAVTYILGLWHPEIDNNVFCTKKNKLVDFMRCRDIVFDDGHKSGNAGNLSTFAESALNSMKHIVIIVSRGMNELCKCGIVWCKMPGNLLNERNYDMLPITVLCSLKNKMGNHVVHLVSLERTSPEGQILLSEFEDSHRYLQQALVCFRYNFHGDYLDYTHFSEFIDNLLKS